MRDILCRTARTVCFVYLDKTFEQPCLSSLVQLWEELVNKPCKGRKVRQRLEIQKERPSLLLNCSCLTSLRETHEFLGKCTFPPKEGATANQAGPPLPVFRHAALEALYGQVAYIAYGLYGYTTILRDHLLLHRFWHTRPHVLLSNQLH